MPHNLKLPNITGATTQEQVRQINSFLYSTIEQLNYVLGSMEKSSETIVEQIKGTSSATETQEKAESTFNSIKALIIKSADIVEAYGDVIKESLKGEYAAISDFGNYLKVTDSEYIKTSEYAQQAYERLEKIDSDLYKADDALINIKAKIKTGYLYTDANGVARYGLGIGEKVSENGVETFNRYACFTSDRLSFFDQNGVEVAYISNYKLYITNVEIIGNLKLGGYIYDTSNGIAHKWVGRS